MLCIYKNFINDKSYLCVPIKDNKIPVIDNRNNKYGKNGI